MLFFGNRNEESDFLYKEEWHHLESAGHLKLVTSFSRDQVRVYLLIFYLFIFDWCIYYYYDYYLFILFVYLFFYSLILLFHIRHARSTCIIVCENTAPCCGLLFTPAMLLFMSRGKALVCRSYFDLPYSLITFLSYF
jgi:hypothetical protein